MQEGGQNDWIEGVAIFFVVGIVIAVGELGLGWVSVAVFGVRPLSSRDWDGVWWGQWFTWRLNNIKLGTALTKNESRQKYERIQKLLREKGHRAYK